MQVIGYFDASGTHLDKDSQGNFSPSVVVAGYLATTTQWIQFDKEWQAHLADYKIEKAFHLTDFSARKKDYADWDDSKRHSFFVELVDIIRRNVSYGIGMSLRLADYEQAILPDEPIKNIFPFSHPLHFCTFRCWEAAYAWAETNGYDGNVSYVFETGDQYQNKILEVHSIICSKYEEIRKEWRFGDVGSLTFDPKNDKTPLQAADVLANEFYREEYRNLYMQKDTKPSFTALIDIPGMYSFSNENLLNEYARRLIPALQKIKLAS